MQGATHAVHVQLTTDPSHILMAALVGHVRLKPVSSRLSGRNSGFSAEYKDAAVGGMCASGFGMVDQTVSYYRVLSHLGGG